MSLGQYISFDIPQFVTLTCGVEVVCYLKRQFCTLLTMSTDTQTWEPRPCQKESIQDRLLLRELEEEMWNVLEAVLRLYWGVLAAKP